MIVTEIFAAGESPIEGLDGSRVAAALGRHGHTSVSFEPDLAAVPDRLRESIRPGDVVVTLGAGSVWTVGEELIRSATTDDAGAQPRRSA